MSKSEKRLSRLFTTAKIVLVIYPFLTLIYLSAGALQGGQDMMAVVTSSPAMTIAFLTAMVQPFVAGLLGQVYKSCERSETDFAVLNLLLLFIAEAMMRNILGMIGLGVLFYQTLRTSDFSLKKCFSQNTAGAVARAVGGSLAVLPVAALCLFAILQISG